MIKEIPKKVIAEVPKGVRFYEHGDGEVIQTDITKCHWPFACGDVLLSKEICGVLLGASINTGCKVVVFYNDITEQIEFFSGDGEEYKQFKKVGHINL